MKSSIVLSIVAAICVFFSPAMGLGASVTSGTFTMNLDRNALAQLALNPSGTPPTLYLEEFWNAAASAFLTPSQLNTPGVADLVPGVGEISATNLVYEVTDATVLSPPGRAIQATNFTYEPANVTGTAAGQVGLGGVMRFMGNFPGVLVTGDYALRYDPTRVGNLAGGSGWFLLNNYGFPIPAWDLTDVIITSDASTLSLTGTLKWSPEVAAAFFTPADIGQPMGTFTFVAPVPLPAAAWLFGSGVVFCLAGITRRRMVPRQ
ncbi:MAG: hypothetical protein NZM29_05520 [Nitrospira sp.]|nr:hypothetical protein [Nitrospira sp.]